MKALYRKYRPVKLSEVVGQEQVVKPLESSLRSGKISHAYIFIGPRGCGKTSVARIFAHEINKFPYTIEDDYTDIIEIDGASNTGVDNIRELKEKAVIAPTKGKFKVYIIDEVHMLSKSAFNALLKTLEEPPKHVIFIMATTDAYKIPPTITSRAQIYNFNLATPDVMKKHLENIAKKEKINITSDALDVIIAKGGGSFRDSISQLDQISTLGSKIDKDLVISALGVPEESQLDSLLSAYKQGNQEEITANIKTILNSGIKAETVAENLINQIIKAPEPELLPLLEKLPEVSSPFPEAKLLLAFLAQSAVRPQITASTSKVVSIAPKEEKAPKTPKKASQEAVEAKEEKSPQVIPEPVNFSWEALEKAILEKNSIIANSLKHTEHQLQGNTLLVYIPRKFDRTILEADNNLELIKSLLPTNIILEFTDDKSVIKKDQKISKISDIMGDIQEVETNGVPF